MKEKTLLISISLSLLLAFPMLFLTGCHKMDLPVSQSAFAFDTVIQITIYEQKGASGKSTDEIFQRCFSLCSDYEAMFSRTVEGSDIWNINHAKGAAVTVHPETAALLKKSLDYCKASHGLLDITIVPVSSLYDFHTHTLPSEEQIFARLPYVDYRNLQIDGTQVTLSCPQAGVDLGCIAKGYIADCLKDALVEEGVTSAIINLGGNVLTLGRKPDNSPFTLGIRKPFDPQNRPIATLPVSDASLVSSGIDQRCFEKNGILYHHLLEPKTGLPASNGLLSVTILSRFSADGDALSTACFLMGLKEGMDYVESLPDTEAVFITEDYQIFATSGLKNSLSFTTL